ncbi:MAG: hypothetical protein LUC94_03295 [Clostridiales bacterium]|nr:hypothetical protein [Clostridiales bacterium]
MNKKYLKICETAARVEALIYSARLIAQGIEFDLADTSEAVKMMDILLLAEEEIARMIKLLEIYVNSGR